jgi:hypothetical protein
VAHPAGECLAVIGAELVWAARKEMVVTLADAVIRRTPLRRARVSGDQTIEHAAQIVGGELEWTREAAARGDAAVKRFLRDSVRLGLPPSALSASARCRAESAGLPPDCTPLTWPAPDE